MKLWYFTQWELLAETFPNLQGLGNVKIEMTNRVGDPKLSMKYTIVVTLASYKNKQKKLIFDGIMPEIYLDHKF